MTGAGASYAAFGFDSTYDALRAETVLLASDVDVVLIPTPRALGTLCGFAVRVRIDQRDAACAVFEAEGIDPTGEIELEERTRGTT